MRLWPTERASKNYTYKENMNFIFILSFISAILCKKFEKVEQYYIANGVNSELNIVTLRPPEDGGLNHRNTYRGILRINYCEKNFMCI
jgi:hypothetical protein